MRKVMLTAALLPLVSGCVAQAAWEVATLPVKAAGKTVDVLTVSPKERDEKWAREQRKAEERQADEDRKARKRAAKDARRDRDD